MLDSVSVRVVVSAVDDPTASRRRVTAAIGAVPAVVHDKAR